jgi:hypothetical protein
MVGREFYQEMAEVYAPWITRVIRAHKSEFAHGRESVLVLFDNAPTHKAAQGLGLLDAMGLLESQRLPHPPESYDFQLPIEWFNGAVKEAFKTWLYEHPHASTADQMLDGLKSVVPTVWTPQQVQAAFSKQLQAYAAILQKRGGYSIKDLA